MGMMGGNMAQMMAMMQMMRGGMMPMDMMSAGGPARSAHWRVTHSLRARARQAGESSGCSSMAS
jgi:hypothetical protein